MRQLLRVERPKVVETVAWAAGNSDRSENGDYIYGKRRLCEIDRRIRFLSKRLERAEVVPSSTARRSANDGLIDWLLKPSHHRPDGPRGTRPWP
jgi:transcription elongation GreA/GreB family factor